LWIESEGTLPTEAQQYGAWIRAPPFVQSKRNSVSIPRFYKTKSAGPTTTSTLKPSIKPQVVIRRGGSALEIFRSGQGSEIPNQEGIKFLDFHEANPMESSPFHTNHNNLGEVNAINTDLNRGSLSAELFEEKLEEINHDLRKFDAATEFHSKSNSPTGKENNLDSMTINEIFLKSTQSRATSHGCPVYHFLFYPILQTLTQGIQLLGNVRLGPSQARMSLWQM